MTAWLDDWKLEVVSNCGPLPVWHCQRCGLVPFTYIPPEEHPCEQLRQIGQEVEKIHDEK